jgi:CDP-glycerol glycerophosphotransferase (TagB/SpsB family)
MKKQRSKPTEIKGIKKHILNFCFAVASAINAIIPKFKIISMCSTPDFSDNSRALYDYLQNNQDRGVLDKHIIVWHVRDPKTSKKVACSLGYNNIKTIFIRRNKLVSFLLFCLSDFIISTHGLYSMVSLTNKQHNLYLYHGMPIKNVGYLYENDVRLGVTLGDQYFVTSKYYKEIFKKMFKAKAKNINITGFPRNDFICASLNGLQSRALDSLGDNIVLYLPTYRKSNGRNKSNGLEINTELLRFGGNKEEWIELSKALKSNNMNMVIKPHPLEQSVENDFMDEIENIHVINDEWLLINGLILNQLFQKSCLLITDYSSVYIDYLLIDKPMLLFLPDEKEYIESRGLVFDKLDEFIACPVINDFGEIKQYLSVEDRYCEARKKINDMLNEVKIGDACKNVLDVINQTCK